MWRAQQLIHSMNSIQYKSTLEDRIKAIKEVQKNIPFQRNNIPLITQHEAEQAFTGGVVLGEGGQGIVHLGKLSDQTPVVIKRYESDNILSAVREYHAHMTFYQSIDTKCREFFPTPLRMQIPFEHGKSVYLAQRPLHNDGESIVEFTGANLHNLINTVDQAIYLLFSIQNIIECMSDAAITQDDIKEENVLIINRDYPVIRVIDFGLSTVNTSKVEYEEYITEKFAKLVARALSRSNATCLSLFKQALDEISSDFFSSFLRVELNKKKRKFPS